MKAIYIGKAQTTDEKDIADVMQLTQEEFEKEYVHEDNDFISAIMQVVDDDDKIIKELKWERGEN